MKYKLSPFILAISVSVMPSCGKKDGGNSANGLSPEPLQPEQQVQDVNQPAEGSYRSILRPFNTQLNGYLPSGVATIKIVGDLVEVTTTLDDDKTVTHMQNIHMGTKCPSDLSDANSDGMVDEAEATMVAGPVLIPLDDDLSGQAAGGLYPMGSDTFKNYKFSYQESASLNSMMNDLSSGEALSGHVKLAPGAKLNLAGRVILIHGTESVTSTPIPPTVASMKNLPQHEAMPILCGVIVRQ